jgi:acetyl-CoA carboxylase carboxyltransferase component
MTKPAFRAAARHHARGKLTVQEKLALLFDAGSFVESMVPAPELEPRHGERRLLTGQGEMQGRPVAAAIFDSSIAAGSVTISTGEKLIHQMRQAEAQHCPLSSIGIRAARISMMAWPRWIFFARSSPKSTRFPAAFRPCRFSPV